MASDKRLDIPFVSNPGNGCALACYTMAAKHFFPETTFEQIAELSDWKPGYVVWGFRFRNWMLQQGFNVKHIENLDYNQWANEGIDGLRKAVPQHEFEYYMEHTYDLNLCVEQIQKMFSYDNFSFELRRPSWEDVLTSHNNNEVCTLTIDAAILDNKEGCLPHAIILLNIDAIKNEVTIHDPRGKKNARPHRKETIKQLCRSFENHDGAELVTYKKI